ALQKRGDAQREQNHLAEAEATYRQALTLAQELGDLTTEGVLWDSLGLLAADQEQWDQALEDYDRALRLFQLLNLPKPQGTLAVPADLAEQVMQAERGARRAWAGSALTLGDSARANRNWVEAEAGYRQGLSLARELGDSTREALVLNKLGLLAEDQERWDEAI